MGILCFIAAAFMGLANPPAHPITDRKLLTGASYSPVVLSATDYYAFGAPIAERSFNASGYRYGFNGKEKLNELSGAGNSLDFGARVYDSRIGRWMSVDPKTGKYPHLSPYNFVDNNPIELVDPDGKDIVNPKGYVLSNKALIQKLHAFDVALAEISGRDIHSYKIAITGGDRYRDSKGAIRSSTNNGVIKTAATQSRHLQENGAIGVDLATGNWDIKTLKKAAEQVGLRINPDGEPYKDGHFHLDMGLGKKADDAKKVYNASNPDRTYKPIDKDFNGGNETTPKEIKDVGKGVSNNAKKQDKD